jgi:protein-S-isoprenylcysteine O-methyltransferase Ste14
MFVLFRALVFAVLFMGFAFVFVPARILTRAGIAAPEEMGVWQIAGMFVAGAGATVAVWCVLTFAFIGKGTPAVFDPPRRLVIRGPYRFVRNPMYVGAGFAVAGAALYYRSTALAVYVGLFWALTAVVVRAYEEPTLTRSFGDDYKAYCGRVGRWWPRRVPPGSH